MKHLTLLCVLLAVGACGGSTARDSGSSTGGAGGATSGGTGGAGGAVTGGSAGTASGGTGGAVGGTGGTSSQCLGLSYCECDAASTACQVFSEACFCPCGIEPCKPTCDCACAGGKYLGCGPKDIMQPGALEGVWLVGWSGGMNHYSWVRFNADFSADVLDGKGLPGNAPLWPCSGQGSWLFTAKLYNVHLTLPAGCSSTIGVDLTFESLAAPTGYAKGAILQANVTTQPNGTPLEAYKFAASQCDAGMTSCKSPF